MGHCFRGHRPMRLATSYHAHELRTFEFHYRARLVDRVTRWCSLYFYLCCDRALCESRRCVRNISEADERTSGRARCSFGAHETEISVTRNLFLFRGSVSFSRVRFEIVRHCGIGCLSRRSRLLLWYAFFRPFPFPFPFPFPYFLFSPLVPRKRTMRSCRCCKSIESKSAKRTD